MHPFERISRREAYVLALKLAVDSQILLYMHIMEKEANNNNNIIATNSVG